MNENQARAGSVNSIDIKHDYEMKSEMLQLNNWKFGAPIRILKIANPSSDVQDLLLPQLRRYQVLFSWPQTHRTRFFASHSLRRLAATLQRWNNKTRKKKMISTPTSSHSFTLSPSMHHEKNPKNSSSSNKRTRNSHGKAGDEWLHFVVALARSKLKGRELVE